MRRVNRVDESLVAYSAYASGYLETAMHKAMHVPHRRHLNRIRCRSPCRRRHRRRRHNHEVVPIGSVPHPTAPVVHDGH
jgi:hypothetical protein